MLKNKSLLYGLGSGLILGALLLQLMNQVAPAARGGTTSIVPAPTAADLDRNQLKEAASQYFNVYEKEEKLFKQAEVDAVVEQKVKEEQARLAAAAPAPQAAAKEIYIYITRGVVVSQVGDMLVQAGIIPDTKTFVDEIERLQLTEKLAIGVHTFTGGPHELGAVITNVTTPTP